MQQVTVQDILQVAQFHGKAADQARANSELAKINQAAIHQEELSSLVYEVWDKKSPINGVPAEYFLTQRPDVDPNAEIYLVKDAVTGRVIYFQPHEPELSGHVRMTKANVHTVADGHRVKVAEERARGRIIQQVVNVL